MNYLLAILAGIVQGLTEFLPISSSGHLVLFHELLNFQLVSNMAFDVILHLGTLVALVAFFRRDILKYLDEFFNSFQKWDWKNNANQRISWYIFIGTWPALLTGYFFAGKIEYYFRNPITVSITMILVGIVLYYADKDAKQSKDLEQLNLKESLWVGFAQLIALIPGVSRSGITIIAGLSQKLKREAAAKYSFLLSVPIVLGAGVKELADFPNIYNGGDIWVLIVGFITALITGYLCIKYFLKFLQGHSLRFFVYYRIILGVGMVTLIISSAFI